MCGETRTLNVYRNRRQLEASWFILSKYWIKEEEFDGEIAQIG
jgi:hypothetical protein